MWMASSNITRNLGCACAGGSGVGMAVHKYSTYAFGWLGLHHSLSTKSTEAVELNEWTLGLCAAALWGRGNAEQRHYTEPCCGLWIVARIGQLGFLYVYLWLCSKSRLACMCIWWESLVCGVSAVVAWRYVSHNEATASDTSAFGERGNMHLISRKATVSIQYARRLDGHKLRHIPSWRQLTRVKSSISMRLAFPTSSYVVARYPFGILL